MAGGSGTRLWPMSRAKRPKQLIPFIDGKSLLQIAIERLDGLVPREQQFICAGQDHRRAILDALDFPAENYLAEPCGRDTLNAVGLACAVIRQQDPEAVVAVFTADHLIDPIDLFQRYVTRGMELAERDAQTLVTFGITPTHAATAYGYLELGAPIPDSAARVVRRFKEKPDAATAAEYFEAGHEQYLWNSGMFVWRASTLLRCMERFAPENHEKLTELASAWGSGQRDALLEQIYPTLPRTSIDYAVMEPAGEADDITVAAVPMPVRWLDVGSWPAFAQTREADEAGNAKAAQHLGMDTANTLVASSESDHLIATVGCDDLIIIHTPDATLVCHRDHAEKIKDLHKLIGTSFGEALQ